MLASAFTPLRVIASSMAWAGSASPPVTAAPEDGSTGA